MRVDTLLQILVFEFNGGSIITVKQVDANELFLNDCIFKTILKLASKYAYRCWKYFALLQSVFGNKYPKLTYVSLSTNRSQRNI